MVATFPAGGPTDGVARVLAHELGERLGQRVVVENRGGAGGTLGAAARREVAARRAHAAAHLDRAARLLPRALQVARLRPGEGLHAGGADRHHPAGDHRVAQAEGARRSRNSSRTHARIRAKVNIGDSGVGTTLHILAAQMALMTGITIQHVHYRGAAGSVADVLGGQIEAALSGFVPTYVTMKVLGVTWTERLKALPDVPTFRESGLDIVSGLSLTLAAPAGTPLGRDREAQRRHQRLPQERARQELRDQLFAADRGRHAGSRARVPGERCSAARAGDPPGKDHGGLSVDCSLRVMRGHSPSKTGVNALVIRASILFAERWIADSSPAMTA